MRGEMKKKTIICTDYSELEQLINHTYKQDYEIMPMEEVGSSQYAATYTQHVKKGGLSAYDKERLQTLLDGTPEQFMLNVIMQDMGNKGVLEEGEYIIDVNW